MPAAAADAKPIVCDGCGREATDEHLRLRIARLEWASRYRPIRIGTLLLTPAPPAALEDYFYFPQGEAGDPEARVLQDDLLACCGIAAGGAAGRDGALRQFQQDGYFLAECVECPIGELGDEEFDALLGRLTPTLVRRIRFSYRPKAILPISERLTGVAEALRLAGVEARLLMPGAEPVSLPKSSDQTRRARFRAEVGSLLG